jgi:hypothetical protein
VLAFAVLVVVPPQRLVAGPVRRCHHLVGGLGGHCQQQQQDQRLQLARPPVQSSDAPVHKVQVLAVESVQKCAYVYYYQKCSCKERGCERNIRLRCCA